MLPSIAATRFIPAPAGNRLMPCGQSWVSAVHPRACGEQSLVGDRGIVYDGSSPRLRGTVAAMLPSIAATRFIPAPAGNRHRAASAGLGTPVHPRACGEQEVKKIYDETTHGSSPRLRGTDLTRVASSEAIRFIPAPAGNRSNASSVIRGNPVHPRACGEQHWPFPQ